jgi:hypothetical protein
VLPAKFSGPALWLVGLVCCSAWQFSTPACGVTLNAVDRGWYRSDGRHITDNENTFSGFASARRYHSYYVFDLASLAGTVDSAALHLELEQYTSFNSSLTFDLFDVTATAAQLNATYIQPDATGTLIHNDLGSGTIYATKSVTAANVGNILNIPLNMLAESAIEGQLGGKFAIGLSVQGPNSSPDYSLRFGDDDVLETIQLELSITPPEVLPEDPPPAGPTLALPEPSGLLSWIGLNLCFAIRRRMRLRQPVSRQQ